MKLLVVGATGGLGRVVVADAVERGHEVSALVRDPARSNLPEAVRTVRATCSSEPNWVLPSRDTTR